MPPRTLHDLINRYRPLYDKPPRSRTGDEETSLTFLTEELARIDEPDRPAVSRLERWVADVRAAEAFVVATGQLPRARRRGAPTPAHERHLEAFLRVSRRETARERMCSWQKERLTLIPGYRVRPSNGAWGRTCGEYARFVARNGRQPVKRTTDRAERRLAIWAVTQRAAFRAGELAASRTRRLEAVPGWMWNPPGRIRR